MKKGIFAAALLALCASSGGLRAEEDVVRRRTDEAVAKVYPALVQVLVVTVDYQQGREFKAEAAGSGVIISPEGHVVTNHHVAGKAKRIQCVLANREKVEATLVGTDPLADISVLKLDLAGRKDPKAPLPVAQWGDSSKLRLGDHVLAMGSPVALSQSVTLGIVSNLGFTIPALFWPYTFKNDGEEVGTLVKWIGHDAAIYGGNSGGPLTDLEGRVVGINELNLGLSGAIPGNLARDVANQLIGGGVRRSWIGLTCQPLLKGSGPERGALVSEVFKGSPAETAGLKAGDVLVSFNRQPVSIRFAEEIPEFNALVLGTPPGSRVPVEFLREGKPLSADVVTAAREAARGDERELKAWGVTARRITELSARELRRPNKKGVFVWSVRPGGPAGEAKPALASGDVIVKVGDAEVEGLEHLEKLTEAPARGKDPAPVLVAFERKEERLLTLVHLGAAPEEQKPEEALKAWLGIAFQVLSEEMTGFLGVKATGVRVTQVFPGSAAAAGGLRAGDIVIRVDGQVIPVAQPEDAEVFAQMVRSHKIGAVADLTVLRGPRLSEVQVPVKLMARPTPEAEVKHYKDDNFSFEAREVAFMDRVREDWEPGLKGAVVVAVEPGGWAAVAHLAVGDLIQAVDGKAVGDVAELESALKAIESKKNRYAHLFVRRGIHTLFVEMEPAWGGR